MVSINTVAITAAAFGLFGPSVIECKRAEPDDPQIRSDILVGGLTATALSLLLTVVIANNANSGKPYLYWAATVSGMFFVYEFMFKGDTESGCGCEGRKQYLKDNGLWHS